MIYTTNILYHRFTRCTAKRFKYLSSSACGSMKKTLFVVEEFIVDIPLILLIIGVLAVIASFFVGSKSRAMDDELENVSVSLHQETSNLKKRVRLLEEELMVASPSLDSDSAAPKKTIHAIILNQITSLHSQGYTIPEIAKRASLSEKEVTDVLHSKGVRVI